MTRKKSFQFHLKQLEETFTEYLDTKNAKDKLTRLRELRCYLRIIKQIAEQIENEEYRKAPHLALRRIMTIERQINP